MSKTFKRSPSGLWITEEPEPPPTTPDQIVMERLREVMNAEATKLGASEISLVATLALLSAQLCGKHCGNDLSQQKQWLQDFYGAIETSLTIHTDREPTNELQREIRDKYRPVRDK